MQVNLYVAALLVRSSTSTSENTVLKHIKGLDTLRAFAVLFVLIQHWGPLYRHNHPILQFIQCFFVPDGGAGVHMFFVLSGFLITGILLKAKEDAHGINRIGVIKNFFARRALRIFPIYYILIFILYFCYPDVKENIAYFLTYTSNILSYRTNSWNSASHTWTLAVEEQFYLFWPWLILFINSKYLKYVFAGAIAVGISSTYLIQDIKRPLLMFNSIDAFGIGAWYAYARLNERHTLQAEKIMKIIAPVFLLLYLYWKAVIFTGTPLYAPFLIKTADSILTIWLIMRIVNNRSALAKKYVLENRFLNFIGKISYCLYLIHIYVPPAFNRHIVALIFTAFAGHQRVIDLLITPKAMYIFDLFILLTIAWLSYYLIEQPILRLKNRFKYTDQNSAPA